MSQSSTSAINVNKQFSTLWLNGGYDPADCNPNNLRIDLRVAGGALIKKSLCVLGNVEVKGTISGSLCGDICTNLIYANPLVGTNISVLGNLEIDPFYNLIASVAEINKIKTNCISELITGEGVQIRGPLNVLGNSYVNTTVVNTDILYGNVLNCIEKITGTDLLIQNVGNLVINPTGNICLNSDTNETIIKDNLAVFGNAMLMSNVAICGVLSVDTIKPKTKDFVTILGNVVLSTNCITNASGNTQVCVTQNNTVTLKTNGNVFVTLETNGAWQQGTLTTASGANSRTDGVGSQSLGVAAQAGGFFANALNNGQYSLGCYGFSGMAGAAQFNKHIVSGTTTGPGTISLEDTTNGYIITVPLDAIWTAKIQLAGVDLTTTDSYAFNQNIKIKNVSNVLTITGMSFDVLGEGTLSTVNVNYTSISDRFIVDITTLSPNVTRWVATIDSTQVSMVV